MAKSIPASMRLQNLQSEPKRLLSEAEFLNEELDALVMDNYRVFIDNLTCSVYLRNEDKKICDFSTELGKDLLKFGQQCHHFRDRVGNYITAHKRNRKTLKHNMQLVELLEIPQLVDACSRNGFFDEAMELAIFVNGLERKHVLASEVRVSSSDDAKAGSDAGDDAKAGAGGGYGVVQSIVDDVHVTLLDLRKQLLVQLSEESSLPKLLQTLGVLRKLDSILVDRQLEDEKHNNFSPQFHSESAFECLRKNLLKRIETTLQMNFLEARSVWIEREIREVLRGNTSHSRLIQSADVNDTVKQQLRVDYAKARGDQALGPYGRGIELLEICRSSWYAIVTQYNALFAESVGEYSSRDLLSFWLESQLKILQVELKDLLVNIDEGPSVRSLIEQCFSFSDRMGQVGCDFSGQIVPIFEEVVATRVGSTWRHGLRSFKQMVEAERCTVEAEGGRSEQVMPLYLRQDHRDDDCDDGSGLTSPSSTLSSALMSFPPLAYLVNSFLIGVNFLRDCPLLTLRDQLLTIIGEVFRDLCNFLVLSSDDIRTKGGKYTIDSAAKNNIVNGTNKGAAGNSMLTSQDNIDRVYAAKVIDDVIPHCLECFKIIFGSSVPSTAGLSGRADFAKKSDLHFFGHVKEIDEGCRKVLVSGGLIQAITSVPVSGNVNSSAGPSKHNHVAKSSGAIASITALPQHQAVGNVIQ